LSRGPREGSTATRSFSLSVLYPRKRTKRGVGC
jgi:hypothetical protein